MNNKKLIKSIIKVFARLFQKTAVSKAEPWSRFANREISYRFKDQEGSQNNPVDCFGVGNPIKGFPKKLRLVQSDNSAMLFL